MRLRMEVVPEFDAIFRDIKNKLYYKISNGSYVLIGKKDLPTY